MKDGIPSAHPSTLPSTHPPTHPPSHPPPHKHPSTTYICICACIFFCCFPYIICIRIICGKRVGMTTHRCKPPQKGRHHFWPSWRITFHKTTRHSAMKSGDAWRVGGTPPAPRTPTGYEMDPPPPPPPPFMRDAFPQQKRLAISWGLPFFNFFLRIFP